MQNTYNPIKCMHMAWMISWLESTVCNSLIQYLLVESWYEAWFFLQFWSWRIPLTYCGTQRVVAEVTTRIIRKLGKIFIVVQETFMFSCHVFISCFYFPPSAVSLEPRKGKKERLTAPRRGRWRQCVLWEGVGLLPICRLKYKEKLPLNNSRLRKGCVTK